MNPDRMEFRLYVAFENEEELDFNKLANEVMNMIE